MKVVLLAIVLALIAQPALAKRVDAPLAASEEKSQRPFESPPGQAKHAEPAPEEPVAPVAEPPSLEPDPSPVTPPAEDAAPPQDETPVGAEPPVESEPNSPPPDEQPAAPPIVDEPAPSPPSDEPAVDDAPAADVPASQPDLVDPVPTPAHDEAPAEAAAPVAVPPPAVDSPSRPEAGGALTIRALPASSTIAHAFSPVSGMAVIAGLGLGTSAAAVGVRRVRAWRHERATAPGPTPRPGPLDLAQLLRRVQGNPFDGEARFRLGLELLTQGQDDRALQLLAQAFRYQPAVIVELLREPRHARARDHAGVRLLLQRFHRRNSQRLWAGYT